MDQLEKQLINSVSLNAGITFAKIAKQLGLPLHTVRYRLHSMIERGELFFRPLVNPALFGLTAYTMFFHIYSHSRAQRKGLLERLAASPWVTWLSELEGDASLGMTLCVRDPEHLLKVLAENFNSEDIPLGVRGVSQIFRAIHFPSFDNPGERQSLSIKVGGTFRDGDLDELNHCLLSNLESCHELNFEVLGRKCNCTPSTARNRINTLQACGVVTGYTYMPTTNIIQYILLIRERTFSINSLQQLQGLANKIPGIIWLYRFVGRWDWEIGVQFAKDEEENVMLCSEDVTRHRRMRKGCEK